MGLDFAVEQLVATGWSAGDPRGCGRTTGGLVYPELTRIEREFAAAGFRLRLQHIPLFDCYRAEWLPEGTVVPEAEPAGAVVGHSEAEAGVFALSRLRAAMALPV